MKIILPKSELKSESKKIKQSNKLPISTTQNIIVKALGFSDMGDYTQFMRENGYKALNVHQHNGVNTVSSLSYTRLMELNTELTYELRLANTSKQAPKVEFIQRELKRRKSLYLKGENKHRLSLHLTLAPMLANLSHSTAIISNVYQINNHAAELFLDNLIERYSKAGILIEHLSQAVSERSLFIKYLDNAYANNLYELLVHITNQNEVDCGESYLLELVVRKLKGEIGREAMLTMLTAKVMEDMQYQIKVNHRGDSGLPPELFEPEFISSPIEKEPSTAMKLLGAKSSTKPHVNGEAYKFKNCAKYVFNLGVSSNGDEVHFSKGDLIEGLYINGTYSSARCMSTLIDVHIKSGGGLIGFINDGDLSSVHKVFEAAHAAKRERDVIVFNSSALEGYLTPERVKSYVQKGKIVYIDMPTVEKTPFEYEGYHYAMEQLLMGLRSIGTKPSSFKQFLFFANETNLWGENTFNTFRKVRGELARLSIGLICSDRYSQECSYGCNMELMELEGKEIEGLDKDNNPGTPYVNKRIRQIRIKGLMRHQILLTSEEVDRNYPYRRELDFNEFLYVYDDMLVYRDKCHLYGHDMSFKLARITLNNP